MAKLKFTPDGYQDLGAYALLKNVVENGHLVAEDSPVPQKPYKVYTALLTQSGGNYVKQMSGDGGGDLSSAIKGTTVLIVANPNNKDYSSIGAPNNNVGTYFVLTQDITLSNLDNDTLFNVDLGTPVVTVLENTIGNIWFEYVNPGSYLIKSDGLFITDKTVKPANYIISPGPDFLIFNDVDESSIEIASSAGDSAIYNVAIEIRVYN